MVRIVRPEEQCGIALARVTDVDSKILMVGFNTRKLIAEIAVKTYAKLRRVELVEPLDIFVCITGLTKSDSLRIAQHVQSQPIEEQKNLTNERLMSVVEPVG